MPITRPDRDLPSPNPSERLPDVRGPRRPGGYRPGLQLGERLQGLLLVLLGIAGCVLAASLVSSTGNRLPWPGIALATPLGCLVPFTFLGGAGLVLVGIRRLVAP